MATIESLLYAAQSRGSANPEAFTQEFRFLYHEFEFLTSMGIGGLHTVKMGSIPYRHFMVHPQLSLFGCSAMTATADVHLGYRYIHPTTNAEVHDDNFWLDNVDAGGGAIVADLLGDITGVVAAGLVPASNVFRTRDGMDIEVMVDTAVMDVGSTIMLMMVYSIIHG
jgi:hypothetical protein